MGSLVKRRRSSMLRNFWIYRRLIPLAFALGLMLWFIVINSAEVTVYFPFRLGSVTSSVGVVILLSALAGSIVTGLAFGILVAFRRHFRPASGRDGERGLADPIDVERPPPDYAAKTGEGFSDAPWAAK